jgi:hypothetical protein
VAKGAPDKPAAAKPAAAIQPAKPAAVKVAPQKPAPAKVMPVKDVVSAKPRVPSPVTPVGADAEAEPVQPEFKHHGSISRDPFRALIEAPRPGEAAPEVRGPGKASLAVDEVIIQGVALGGPTGPVALVMGKEGATYFLRPGDHLHDGVVVRIEPNGILFQKRATETASAAEVFRKIS